MTDVDPLAARRAELERRMAALTPEQRVRMATPGAIPAVVVPSIPLRDPSAPIPLAFAQELLYRLERASPGSAYNVPRSVRLEGALDAQALQRALDALVVRHAALRTVFVLTGDDPHQVERPPAPVVIEPFDLTALPSEEREGAARQRLADFARQPFDLEHDAQLRVSLIRLGPEDHVLQLVSHHVVSDGWSGNILLRELGTLYEGFRRGEAVTLPPLPLTYADYAAWQRESLVGERLAELLEFWRKQFEGAPTRLDLPSDRARAVVPVAGGAFRTHTLPVNVVQQMSALARATGATNFMVLLSALYVQLARYTGEEEIVIGTPVAGRPHPQLEGIVGFFANTLLLRGSVAGAPTFRALLARVRTQCLAAFDHQEIPLESLLMATGADGRPLVSLPQVVLSTEDPDRERMRLAGTSATQFAASLGNAKFDLMLWAADRPDGLRVVADYRTSVFDDATVERMLRHFGVLLAAAVEAPDTPVTELPLLDETERAQLLTAWNDTAAGYPVNATIHGLIEEQVRQRPTAVAVECTRNGVTERLTYAELDARANRVAHTLRAAGVVTDARVALCLDRSVDTVIAILGVLKAGGAYLPIDPDYPDERIEFTLQDAGAVFLLTDAGRHARLTRLAPALRTLTVAEAVAAGESDVAPLVVVSPRDMAYVIYTSGSTGRPKGCMVEHRNVTRLLVNDRSEFDFNERDVWTVFHSFAFDFSVWELFGALIFGGRAVVVPREVAQNSAEFLALLERTGTTVLNQVPSAFQPLMEESVTRNAALSVRYVIFGGEALKPALLKRWRAYRPGARLINMFGITETTVHVTFKEIGETEIESGLSNIGRPIPTTTLYVLDRSLQPVPIGVAGELCVGGLGVARGYLNRPELSAERFVPDPYASEADALLYRSGDLGRQLPNGEIEYIGRRDTQVKLRGHRIELGEIEAALLKEHGVRQAVVLVREDALGDQRLVAYVVLGEGITATAAVFRDGLRLSLPEIMIPSAIEFLDRIPLTGNGKIDLRALPVPRTAASGKPYREPRHTIEHEIVQIWESLLSPGRPISVLDDFWEIGGHSLLAIKMLAQIERVRGQRVPLAWLFESSTVAALAARLESSFVDLREPVLVTLQAEGTGTPVAFVHGDWTGGGWYVRRLAPLVAPECPFVVLPTLGADGDEFPWTIESMAAHNIAALKQVQPRGPYRIVGFCMGGLVAFEMAQQLRTAGDTVASVVIIDTIPANVRIKPLRPLLSLLPSGTSNSSLNRRAAVISTLRRSDIALRRLRTMPLGDRLSWLAALVARRTRRLLGVPVATLAGSDTVRGDADDHARELEEVVSLVQHRASSVYVPGEYPGTLEIIWAEGTPEKKRAGNPVERWRTSASRVALHAIPSEHMGLITNNIPMLAAALRKVLGHGTV